MIANLFKNKSQKIAALTIGEITGQLNHAESELDMYRLKLVPLSLSYLQGEVEAASKVDELEAEIETAQKKIRLLKSAQKAAEQRDARAEEDARKTLYAEQFKQSGKHLDKRDSHAATLQESIRTACESWRGMVSEGEAARAAMPGTTWPNGSLCDIYSIKQAIEIELFRASNDGSLGGAMIFPGGNCHDLSKRQHPQAFLPLADTSRKATSWLQEQLRHYPPHASRRAPEVVVFKPLDADPLYLSETRPVTEEAVSYILGGEIKKPAGLLADY